MEFLLVEPHVSQVELPRASSKVLPLQTRFFVQPLGHSSTSPLARSATHFNSLHISPFIISVISLACGQCLTELRAWAGGVPHLHMLFGG